MLDDVNGLSFEEISLQAFEEYVNNWIDNSIRQ